MDKKHESIVKALIAVAWADGRVGDEEKELIDTLIDTYQISGEDAGRIRKWAGARKTLDEVDLAGLDEPDRLLVLQQAVYVTFLDGVQTDDELKILGDLGRRLGVGERRAGEIVRVTTERARTLFAAEKAAPAP